MNKYGFVDDGSWALPQVLLISGGGLGGACANNL
jgi:hypothetical protein